jgi:hypothetical protein
MIYVSGPAHTMVPEGSDAPWVGFRQPPYHSQFRKRPSAERDRSRRRRRDLALLLGAALDAPSVLVEDGKRRRVTMRELIAMRLVNRSPRADLHATRLLVDLVKTIVPHAPAPEQLDETEKKVVDSLLARLGMAE